MTEYINAYSNPRIMNSIFSRAETCETYKTLTKNVQAAKLAVNGVKIIGLPELFSRTMIVNDRKTPVP